MATAESVCPLDCPERCTLEVEVRESRLVAVRGTRVNPVTEGFICAKVRRYPERVYGPDRLHHPMRRVGRKGEGRLERASWDAALGASRLARTVCAAQTGLVAQAMYGKMASVDFPDFARARFILIWGANPKHSNIHLMPQLKRAREAGAQVALVDPRRTLGEAYLDLHLPVFPGSDLAVALPMIGHLERIGRVDRDFLESHATGFDRLLERAREWPLTRAAGLARVEPEAIARIAEAYAEADPAVVRCGWGVERNRNGEAAVAAILSLPAVAGKFGKPGGGYALSASEAYGVDGARLAGPGPETRVVNMTRLGRALLEEPAPPVELLFVYDANLAVTLPDQDRVRRGLEREDLFTVVFDQVMTDTARYADVVLPATTFLEHAEVSTSYGTYALGLGEPVIAPVGEARTNPEVFAQLGERLGIAVPRGEGLLAEVLEAVAGPLALLSAATDRSVCSTLAKYGFSRGFVEMHPDDAAARGLAKDAIVRVHNGLGEVHVPQRLDADVRTGVVQLPKGLWNRHTRNGSVGAALVPDDVSPLSGGARFNDARVQVSPL